MSAIELTVGQTNWTFDVPNERLVRAQPREPAGTPVSDVATAVRDAMDHPLRFDHPLKTALTPDDRIALVVDEQLPRLGELIGGILQYLASAGIGPESVTIITAPGGQASDWIDELPDEFADVHTEVHHPDDRKLLSYLSTTKGGRRIYLNRTLVDADQAIVLSGRAYDVQFGYGGCEGAVFPTLADAEARKDLAGELTTAIPTAEAQGVRAEALEVAWLMSSTLFIQVIEAEGDGIAQIRAGLIASIADGIPLQDDRWKFEIDKPVDMVIASVSGDPRKHDFATLARAATAASRIVSDGGCIVILSEGETAVGEGLELLRQADSPEEALRLLRKVKPADPAAAYQWASAADRARIYLVSGIKPEIVEEIFATPICSVEEVQRLIDGAGSCLVLPDGHKSLVVVK